MADEARAFSAAHQAWILDLLRRSSSSSCSYDDIVVEGERHHCDTVGAMLKILKRRKVVAYEPAFLMYPMHKLETITLLDPTYDPNAS